MTKSEIEKSLNKKADGAILMSISEIAKAMKLGRDTVRETLKNTPYDPRGNSKMYYIEDVAKIFAERLTL